MIKLLGAISLLVLFVLVSAGIMIVLGERKVNILAWVWCFPQQFIGWLRKKYNISYYSFYTEKWADKLGGVER